MSFACEDGYMYLLQREDDELKGHACPNDGDIAHIITGQTCHRSEGDDMIVESV